MLDATRELYNNLEIMECFDWPNASAHSQALMNLRMRLPVHVHSRLDEDLATSVKMRNRETKWHCTVVMM